MPLRCFNPTRVRLKLSRLRTHTHRCRLQPHEGSSETGDAERPCELRRVLQPHEGSSETTRRSGIMSPPGSFNPTRVRLKRGRPGPPGGSRRRLQPHEGSSETRGRGDVDSNAQRLQPHEGSSETTFSLTTETDLTSFNPTRVRLKRLARTAVFPYRRASTPRGFV